MIVVAAIAAIAVAAPSVVENPDPSAKEISIQLFARTEGLTNLELATLRVALAAMPKQTTDYVRRDVLAITGGRPVKTALMPDHVRIAITVSPDGLATGIGLMESLVRRATLTPEQIREAIDRPASRDPWDLALMPTLPMAVPERKDVLNVYSRVFSASNVWLSVGGNFEAGKVQELWAARVAKWERPPKADKYRTIPSRPATPVEGPGVLVLEGKTFGAESVDFATRYLAMIALGTGKGSSLHRLWREREAWSYRQEAVLWPTPDGWQPRLVAAMAGELDRQARASEAKKVLEEDIAAWTSVDLERAKGMAEGALSYGVPFSPLYLSPDGAPDDDLAGRTFLAGYWPLKTGRPWSTSWLLASVRAVRLEDLKETAQDIVAGSRPRWSP